MTARAFSSEPLVSDEGEVLLVRRQALSDTTVHALTPAEWDILAQQFRDVVPEQTAVYACARWGEKRVRCLSVTQSGQLIGGAVLIDFTVPLVRRGLSVIKFGPLWRRQQEPDDAARLANVVSALQQQVAIEDKRCLVINPLPDPLAEGRMADVLQAHGFWHCGSTADPARYLVNLGIDLDAQRASLHGKWRYNLKKAQSNRLDVGVEEGEAGLSAFMALYDAMLSRKRFHDRSAIDALPAMLQADVPSLRPEIVIARLDGRPTAGAVISRAGDRAIYLFGASDERALPAKAGYALHWWIVERLTGSGCLWYDLGGAEGDAGLAQFKRQFVGARGVITKRLDEFAFAADPASRLLAKAAFTLREAKRRWPGRAEATSG
ncbi:lipid II:glycine glycyltransferase FemX [Rhodoligotrophos defluvii]|uniref:lipid II:glycine glycyltransferase FemX n=1 Tax=Rhodoligotrophos defluvii TaxID=2561934 RepID=UPI0014858762|nr:GNAT family N-acetyltransferase [Rhodoligotrophos defluvii]